MNIVVLVKSIPDPNGDAELGDDFLVKRDGEGTLDPGDEYAVEAALQLAEASDGEVTVVSMGPEGAVSAIRRALSMGAHRAVVVTDDALRGADVLATARVLAAAAGRAPFDLVLTGVESTDGYTGTLPMTVAELIGRAGGDVRPHGGGGRGRHPGRAADGGGLRRGRVRAPGTRHRDRRRDRTALPDPQGHHGRETEAAGHAVARRPRVSPPPTSEPRSGWSPWSRRRRRVPVRSSTATRPQAASPTSSQRPRSSDVAKIWVFAEVGADGPAPAALELLTKARELGDAEAVALGPGATAAADALGEHGASTVFASDDPVYDEFLAQPAAHAMHALVQQHAPDLILFATTYTSRDVAGRLQAKTGTALMSNAIDVASVDRARTQIAGGTLFVDVELDGPSPHLVLVRPKSFVAEPVGGTAEVVPVDVEIPPELRTARRVERHEESASGPKLEEARVVISGGRGLQDAANFGLLDQLAAIARQRRRRGQSRRRRRRMGAVQLPGRTDRQDGEAGRLHRGRDQWGAAARGRHEGREADRRDQQGRRTRRSSAWPTWVSSRTRCSSCPR